MKVFVLRGGSRRQALRVVRMRAFNEPLNNLIRHKELKSSREN